MRFAAGWKTPVAVELPAGVAIRLRSTPTGYEGELSNTTGQAQAIELEPVDGGERQEVEVPASGSGAFEFGGR
jgi:hypothetical protein